MKISGQILDANKQPLSGANITLTTGAKANKLGAISDFDGYFTLENDGFEADSEFKISYMGYASKFFKANDLQDKKIVLQEAITNLDEIVVIGTKPTNKTKVENKKNDFKSHLAKNKYVYAGVSGVLGIALLLLSFKKKL